MKPADIKEIGCYSVLGEINRGAMGVVYKAFDPKAQKNVAIKTLKKNSINDPDFVTQLARFKREAEAVKLFSHPNIVSVFDYGENNFISYIVMEYINGASLKEILDKHIILSVDFVAKIMCGVLAALSYLHCNGLVHRDIKPANILVTDSGEAKLADFGIARIESSTLTISGTILGTPSYMSPEQVRGLKADVRSDIFSAGVVFYEMLTGFRPFVGSLRTVELAVLNSKPSRPSDLSSERLKLLDTVVARAMEKKPENRFQNAREFLSAIGNVLEILMKVNSCTINEKELDGLFLNSCMGNKINGDFIKSDDETISGECLSVFSPKIGDFVNDESVCFFGHKKRLFGLGHFFKDCSSSFFVKCVSVLFFLGIFVYYMLDFNDFFANNIFQRGIDINIPSPHVSIIRLSDAILDQTSLNGLGPNAYVPKISAPNLAEIEDAVWPIQSALNGLDCSVLSTRIVSGGVVDVYGFMGNSITEDKLRDIIQKTAPGIPYTITAKVFPRHLCSPLRVLATYIELNRHSTKRLSIRIVNGTKGVLYKGDRLVLDIEGPPLIPHLLVDYFTLDGQVIHLLPNALDIDDGINSGKRIIGDPNKGGRFWDIGAPFGPEIIVAIAATKTFFFKI
ncbi:eukaryotic-like serine/threonine-protein kinase [Azospirillaceae bacterium]